MLAWLQSACSRCVVADVYTENHRQVKVQSEVLCSNERHEEDEAGKQRDNGWIAPEQKQSCLEREGWAAMGNGQWAHAGTTWDCHQFCAKPWLGIASANCRRRLVKRQPKMPLWLATSRHDGTANRQPPTTKLAFSLASQHNLPCKSSALEERSEWLCALIVELC